MKTYSIFLFLVASCAYAQTSLHAELTKKQVLEADQLAQIDQFGAIYYIKDNILYKNYKSVTINYSNVQLGEITSAVIFNPLKIHLFYQDFNTVMTLDNRLAEISKTDFNVLPVFRSVSHIAAANDNAIWLFDQTTQQIELFDYLSKKTRAKGLPIQSDVLALTSNYNHCWLLTKNFLYVYNYTGSIITKLPNTGFTQLEENNGNIYLLKDNQLYFKEKSSDQIVPLKHPELLINQFLVTNETLYIYTDEMLHQFQLKTD